MVSTSLPPTAAAVAVANRLQRTLEELTKAAAAAGTLPSENEQVFDALCHLSGSIASIQKAIANIRAYAGDRMPAPALLDRAARLERARQAAVEFNSAVFGD